VNKKAALPTFNPDFYTKLTLNDLTVYAMYHLHQQGRELASEDILAACFSLFPRRFSLHKYPHWPDSAVVARRWSTIRKRGYLRGDASNGFQITARGIKRAEKIGKSLGKPLPAPKPKIQKLVAPALSIHPELKARARKYVRSIETSDAYKHYKRKIPLNEYDFRSLLLCTMESPPATLARNMEQFKEYVRIHDRADLLNFLEASEARFSHLLQAAPRPAGKK
jgi:hypothetical protein